MERKEAIEVIKKNWPDSSFTMLREALETLVPELKESEDERIRKWLIHYFKEVCDNVSEKEKKGIVAWLEKQPKDSPVHSNSTNIGKVEQKPAEWSEENEKMFEHIIAKATLHFSSINYLDEEEINFLKSLRPQNTWKPSDEQMDALNYVVNLMASSERPTENDLYYNILKSLRQQLKKHYL